MAKWIVYHTASMRVKGIFTSEKKAREYHKEQGGDLVKLNDGELEEIAQLEEKE